MLVPNHPKSGEQTGTNGLSMWFLMRMGFWFSIVLLALPLSRGNDDAKLSGIGLSEAYLAARSAAEDITSFCDRRTETCETGRKIASAVVVRAGEAARLAADYLDSDAVERPKAGLRQPDEDVLLTGSIARQ